MWVIGFCLSGVFLYRVDAPFPLFLGEVLSVFRFFGSFLTSCVFFVGLCPFGNKFLFIQKKKISKKIYKP